MALVDLNMHPDGGVAVLTMNNKGENRFSPELMAELLSALDALAQNDDARAVVLTGGDPKFFSNGLDLEWLGAHATDMKAIGGYLATMNALFHRWTLFPKPTVVALNGHTFAGGFFLAAHLDFRLMREDRGWCCMPEVQINIPLLPGMVAICQAVMPPQSFRQFYYTGQRFTGQQAKAMGFVDEVYPEDELLPQAIALAGKLGMAKTVTYAEMKRRIRQDVADIIEHEDPKYFLSTLGFAM